jgi:hypothetical protein
MGRQPTASNLNIGSFRQNEVNLLQRSEPSSAALRSVNIKSGVGFRCLSLIFFLLLAPLGHTESAAPSGHEYRLRFYHTHTGERLHVVYRRGDKYIPKRWKSSIIICGITAQGETCGISILGSSTFFTT